MEEINAIYSGADAPIFVVIARASHVALSAR
jgi:hypothetical protein